MPAKSHTVSSSSSSRSSSQFQIGLILPDVLGTYGDDGNALIVRQRLRLRGVAAEIIPIHLGDPVPDSLDLYTVGGGEDTAQILASEHLRADGGIIRAANKGTPILAICAGLQVFGQSFRASGSMVDGLGLLDATTSSLKVRMIGELRSEPLQAKHQDAPAAEVKDGRSSQNTTSARTDDFTRGLTDQLTGFANHMGATIVGPDARPLGRVLHGTGNCDAYGAAAVHLEGEDAEYQICAEGAVQGSIIATYMHGPALARNPQLADVLIARALGVEVEDLPPLGDDIDPSIHGGLDSLDMGSQHLELARELNNEVSQLRRERIDSTS
ncbi:MULTISPECIES: type 1 glutamine amidotransferase [Corynebacterium]|uniref:type 1 glutamine amidotransferase n=1 Tax=Corynebacterium TaxID=1716 RepID=UPI00195DB93E|nr:MULTISPECIES: glutamine amidotransferase [Corynebacterium]MDN8624336.1 glutamine amidotransferase [Corynebacterium kroppenstedtii]QRQ65376.1 glutamine amidotransferase [Corynebacterium kroppenstedtii]